MAHAMMLIDTSRCIGCKACQVACQQWHGKEAEDTEFTGSLTNPPEKSGANFNVVKFFEHESGGEVKYLFFPDRCRHCVTPWCKLHCPLNAVYQFPWGGVAINEDRCDPSRCNLECQTNCPYKSGTPMLGVPRFNYMKDGSLVTVDAAQKCDFCYDRFGNADLRGDNDPADPGLGARFKGYFAKFSGSPPYSNRPACEVACPTGAIRCALHNQVIPYAKKRVNELINDGFPDANLYPAPNPSVHTHMLWVLTEKIDVYGLY
jgi:Fe-S-cluster-containing dehydrogenase component